MGDSIAGIEHYTCCSTGCIEGEHSLDGGVEGRHIERLEEDLCSCISIGTRVERGLSK